METLPSRSLAYVIVANALRDLDGRCDGAIARDGQGWNSMHTDHGHYLANKINHGPALTVEDQRWIGATLPIYHRQFTNFARVHEALLSLGWIQLAQRPWEERHQAAQELGLIAPEEVRQAEDLPKLDYRPDEQKFYLYTAKEHRDLARSITSPRWISQEKAWRYLSTPQVITELKKKLPQFKVVTPAAQARLDAPPTLEPTPSQTPDQLQAVNRVKQGEIQNLAVPLRTQLYRHQQQAFEIGVTLDHSAFLMEQGTGKTLAAIAVAGHRFQQGQVKRLLVVAPLSVLSEWKRQFKQHAAFPYHLEILTDAMERRKKALTEWEDTDGLQVAVVNYDGAWRIAPELIGWKPDMIIADESQQIKNGQAKRSKAMGAIGKVAKYRMVLTGTPVTQSPLDFFSQYKFLDPAIFGNSFVKFRDKYAVMGGYGGYQVVGYKNQEDLARKAHSIAYRVTKTEALDLPAAVDQTLMVDLGPKARRIYHQMASEALVKLGESTTITAPIVLTQLLRLQQITGGFLPGQDEPVAIGTEKLDVLTELLEGFPEDKKVVIFARFIPEVKAISERLKKLNIKHVTLVGGISSSGREEAIRSFQEDPSTRVFLAQIATGGLGITLTAADTAIFFSVDYSLTNYEQAKARIHRIGQTQRVTYIHLMAQGTVDLTVAEALQGKRDIAKMMVDDLKGIVFPKEDAAEKEDNNMTATVSKEVRQVLETQELASDITPDIEEILDELERDLTESGQITNEPAEVVGVGCFPEAAEDEGEEEGQEEAPRGSRKERTKQSRAQKNAAPIATGKQPTPDEAPRGAKEEVAATGEVITVKELAAEFGVEARRLRKWLRTQYSRADGRWEWTPSDPMVAEIRSKFKH